MTNITTPLLGLVDVAITGHLGAEYIAAIAVGGNMFNMLYWVFSFLRSGTSGITSQAYGSRDEELQSATLYRALLGALVISLAIIAVNRPVLRVFLDWMDVGGEAGELAAVYFKILIFGSPAFLATYAISGWFIGMQNSRSAMWMSLFINVTNIVASLTFVYGLGMKIEGVALGTLTAQWGGFLFGGVVLLRRYHLMRVGRRRLFDPAELKRLFVVNRDLFLRTVCLVAVTLWFTRVGAREGTLVLAANTLLMQFFMFFSYFTDGFAYAGEAVCGRFYGEGHGIKLRRTINRLLIWGLGLSLAFVAIYGFCGNLILDLLSSDAHVVGLSKESLVWVVILPLTGFAAFIYDGIFIGVTRSGHLLISMIVSSAVFFGSYLFLFPRLGNDGLWIAFLLYLLARGIYLHIAASNLFKTAKA